MIESVMKAPVNLFFDTTPIGMILNRFTGDINMLEHGMPWATFAVVRCSFELLYVVGILTYSFAWLLLLMPVIVFLSYLLVQKTNFAIKETASIARSSYSPCVSHLTESISGVTTIRAYQKEQDFIEDYRKLGEKQIFAKMMSNGVNRWFNLRVDFLGFSVMAICSITLVLIRESLDSVILAMALVNLMTLQGLITWGLQTITNMETQMVSAERCMRLVDRIPQEIDCLNEPMFWP